MIITKPVSTPTPAPIPIPAFVHCESLQSNLASLAGVAVAISVVSVVERVAVNEAVKGATDISVGIDAANNLAMVYPGSALPTAQHESLSPQHHVVEYGVPSHGVTT